MWFLFPMTLATGGCGLVLALSTSEPLPGYIIVTSILFVTLVTSGTHSGGLGAVIALCY